jgi:hypothetical protein
MIKDLLGGGMNGIDLAVMHLVRSHEANPGMMVVLVVPVEELTAEAPRILDAAEASGVLSAFAPSFILAQSYYVLVGSARRKLLIEGPRYQRSACSGVCGANADRTYKACAAERNRKSA